MEREVSYQGEVAEVLQIASRSLPWDEIKEAYKYYSEKIDIRIPDRNNKASDEISRFLAYHNLDYSTRSIYGKLISDYRSNLNPEQIAEFADLVFEAACTALKTRNYYLAMPYLKFLGRTDLIKDFINHEGIGGSSSNLGPDAKGSFVSMDLLEAATESFPDDEERIKQYTSLYLKDRFEHGFSSVNSMESIKYFREKISFAQQLLNQYIEKHRLRSVFLKPELLNAAVELSKEQYDLVVAVMNSGAPLATLLEVLGQNVRYLEWRKHWTKQPQWRNIGLHRQKIQSAHKILVSEDDTMTGTTLKTIAPILQSLGPDQIDVAFTVNIHRTNEAVIENNSAYNKSIDIKKINPEHFFENLQLFTEILQQQVQNQNVETGV